MRDMARSYYIALLHLQKHPALFDSRVDFYAKGGVLSTGARPENFYTQDGEYTPPEWSDIQTLLGDYSGHYFYTGIDFWARRNIDTTAEAFAEILSDLLTTYDQDWLDTEPDGDWVYEPPQ